MIRRSLRSTGAGILRQGGLVAVAMTGRTRQLFSALVKDSAQAGFCEYRTHLSYMDEVARSFDFNQHAMLRLNEKVKDALDPNGILAPGKSGIWPKAYRKGRA
ncbi:MAG: FAD-linked oxidase C-terminal domain-containing protein [Gammaproteobacteria bacterium]